MPPKRTGPRKARSTQRRPRPTSGRAPLAKRVTHAEDAPTDALPVEVEPGRVDESLEALTGTLRHWANAGRYTKVRFKFRGKPLLPDVPLAAVVAAEGLTFAWGGLLRALIVNVAGKSVFQVELVNDSEKLVQRGKEALLAGDLDPAVDAFRQALRMQRDNPRAHLHLGAALKMRGDHPAARVALERAHALDPNGPVGVEAARMLQSLKAAAPPDAR